MINYNETVLDQLAAVRATDKTPLTDRNGVQHVAEQQRYTELVRFCEDVNADTFMAHLLEMGKRY